MIKKYKILTILSSVFLVSCATTNKFDLADYDKLLDNPYPPISLHILRNNSEFRSECYEYDQKSLLHHCVIDQFDMGKIYVQLAESGQFHNVDYDGNNADYELHLSVAGYNHESGKELGQAALAGASLLLLPTVVSAEVKVDASLTWHGFELKRYRYDLPFTQKVSLFNANHDSEKDIAEMITSHLIKGFQDDDVFSAEFLWTALDASNYQEDLTLPDVAGRYLKTIEHRFQHPLLGVQNRYTHENFPLFAIDTFVYPVAHWDYRDQETALRREMIDIQDDIKITLRTSGIDELRFEDIEIMERFGVESPIFKLRGEYTTNDNEILETYIYLGIQKDKFVKIRVSRESGDERSEESFSDLAEAFLEDFLDSIEVPEESLFMLKLRQQWRSTPTASN